MYKHIELDFFLKLDAVLNFLSPESFIGFLVDLSVTIRGSHFAHLHPAPASQSKAGPVLRLERSFLLTAAGQFRIFAGFPFKPNLAIRYRKIVCIWSTPSAQVNVELN
jgi:hypothetical protein